MRRAPFVLLPLCFWACTAQPPRLDGGVPADGGPRIVVDGGEDAGADGGRDAGDAGPLPFACSVAAQDCDGGQRCLLVDGGPQTACLDGACDLVRQDCGAGLKCDYRVDDAGVAARACVPAGSAAEGEPCPTVADPDGCQPGAVCVDSGDDAGTGVCARLCNVDPDCPSEETCDTVLTLEGTAETPGLCTTLAGCDLFAQDCAAGMACYLGRARPGCYPEGRVALGGGCEASSDCVKGAACAQDAEGRRTCRPLCGTSGTPACASGTCEAAQAPAPAGVGVCL